MLQSIVVPELERIASNGSSLPVTDYKSALQEKLQARGRPQPTYALVKERGPEHNKTFTVEARLQPLEGTGKAEFIGRADGSTKKTAEQDAARQVLEYLGTVPVESNGRTKRNGHAQCHHASSRRRSKGKASAGGHHQLAAIVAGDGRDRRFCHHLHRAGVPDSLRVHGEHAADRDYLLVDKLRYGGNSVTDHFMPYKQVRRGDVIVFRYPVHPTQHFVKRVVGVPGDRVRLINRQVFVNGHPLQEPYVRYSSGMHDTFRDEFPRLNLPVPGLEGGWWLEMKKLVEDNELISPEGNYFVLGDNRDESLDSRYWGFVPQENVIGRPLLIYWSVLKH